MMPSIPTVIRPSTRHSRLPRPLEWMIAPRNAFATPPLPPVVAADDTADADRRTGEDSARCSDWQLRVDS